MHSCMHVATSPVVQRLYNLFYGPHGCVFGAPLSLSCQSRAKGTARIVIFNCSAAQRGKSKRGTQDSGNYSHYWPYHAVPLTKSPSYWPTNGFQAEVSVTHPPAYSLQLRLGGGDAGWHPQVEVGQGHLDPLLALKVRFVGSAGLGVWGRSYAAGLGSSLTRPDYAYYGLARGKHHRHGQRIMLQRKTVRMFDCNASRCMLRHLENHAKHRPKGEWTSTENDEFDVCPSISNRPPCVTTFEIL